MAMCKRVAKKKRVSILSLWKRPLKVDKSIAGNMPGSCFNPIIVEEAIKRGKNW